MQLRTLILFVLGMTAILAVQTAPAQTYHRLSLSGISDWIPAAETETIADVKSDADGNRYICGSYTVGYDAFGFVAKQAKSGDLLWVESLYDMPQFVAPDNAGHFYLLYISFDSEAGYYIERFDAATGVFQLRGRDLGQTYGWGMVASDMVCQPGMPPCVSGWIFPYHDIAPGASVVRWSSDLQTWEAGWSQYDLGGTYTSMAVDSNGDIYVAGWQQAGYNSSDYTGIVSRVPADFTSIQTQFYNLPTTAELFTNIAIDPVDHVAVATGASTTYWFPESLATPIYGTFYQAGGSVHSQLTQLASYSEGSYVASLGVNDAGIIAMAIHGNPGATYPQSDVLAFTPDAATPWVLDAAWTGSVASPNAGQSDTVFGLVPTPDGFALGLQSPGSNDLKLYTFANNGSPIDLKIFSDPMLGSQATPWMSPKPRTMTSLGGKLFVAGPGSEGHGVLFSAQRQAGPNDRYEVNEGDTLTIGAGQGVLENDGNGFDLSPQSVFVPSAMPGIEHLFINADGTFYADFTDGFHGTTGFDYYVIQNGLLVASSHVKFQVKRARTVPVAVDDEFPLAMNSDGIPVLLIANDYDLDGDPLKMVSVTSNPHASIKIMPGNRYVKIKPKRGFSGDVTFDYTITDPKGYQATAHVIVHVS